MHNHKQDIHRVRTLGNQWSFHSQAAAQMLPENLELIFCKDFSELLDAQGEERVVVAVENRFLGLLDEHMEALVPGRWVIEDETWLELDLVLAAANGIELNQIMEVRSHPVAFAQCTKWLASNTQLREVPWADTASALASVKASIQDAAIGSRKSALEMGLSVLVADIANEPNNATRFLLLRPDTSNTHSQPSNTMHAISPSTPNQPQGIPMIDLRPLPNRPQGSARQTHQLLEARPLADALGAQLSIAPQTGEAELRWPQGGIHSTRLRDELYLRTGVLLGNPAALTTQEDVRVPLRGGLPTEAYNEAASRIRKHGFYFWQRDQISGVL